ncbi:hypothetical protein B0H12DRAFT_767005 [Mycena haematopus]|nr:hypothetical protein B0H12DRAFT_767005 [Mycena haematopus]
MLLPLGGHYADPLDLSSAFRALAHDPQLRCCSWRATSLRKGQLKLHPLLLRPLMSVRRRPVAPLAPRARKTGPFIDPLDLTSALRPPVSVSKLARYTSAWGVIEAPPHSPTDVGETTTMASLGLRARTTSPISQRKCRTHPRQTRCCPLTTMRRL